MIEREVIIVDGIPENRRKDIIINAIRNAIIAILNSGHEEEIIDLNQKIINKAEPEIAKKIFSYFCNVNSIKVDSDQCTALNDEKWNVKFCFQEIIKGIEENFNDGSEHNNFISLVLNTDQEDLIKKVFILLQNQNNEGFSFDKDMFWAEFNNKGSEIDFVLNYHPQLVIIFFSNDINSENEAVNSNLNYSPSLLKLFPQLQDNIKYGFIKKCEIQV